MGTKFLCIDECCEMYDFGSSGINITSDLQISDAEHLFDQQSVLKLINIYLNRLYAEGSSSMSVYIVISNSDYLEKNIFLRNLVAFIKTADNIFIRTTFIDIVISAKDNVRSNIINSLKNGWGSITVNKFDADANFIDEKLTISNWFGRAIILAQDSKSENSETLLQLSNYLSRPENTGAYYLNSNKIISLSPIKEYNRFDIIKDISADACASKFLREFNSDLFDRSAIDSKCRSIKNTIVLPKIKDLLFKDFIGEKRHKMKQALYSAMPVRIFDPNDKIALSGKTYGELCSEIYGDEMYLMKIMKDQLTKDKVADERMCRMVYAEIVVDLMKMPAPHKEDILDILRHMPEVMSSGSTTEYSMLKDKIRVSLFESKKLPWYKCIDRIINDCFDNLIDVVMNSVSNDFCTKLSRIATLDSMRNYVDSFFECNNPNRIRIENDDDDTRSIQTACKSFYDDEFEKTKIYTELCTAISNKLSNIGVINELSFQNALYDCCVDRASIKSYSAGIHSRSIFAELKDRHDRVSEPNKMFEGIIKYICRSNVLHRIFPMHASEIESDTRKILFIDRSCDRSMLSENNGCKIIESDDGKLELLIITIHSVANGNLEFRID